MTNATSARAGLSDRAHAAWPAVPGRLPLTEDSVRRTVRTSDPAVRNLWITQSYADLARRWLDVFETDQTWCTFAIWASNAAGRSGRGQGSSEFVADEVMPAARPHIDDAVRDAAAGTSFWRRLGAMGTLDRSHVERLVGDVVTTLSGHLADGSARVFGELAPVFVRVVEAFETGSLPDPYDVDRWLDGYDVPSAEACPLVRLAFRHYAMAVGTGDHDVRAQHVFAGNIAVALHEQERLQVGLDATLDAGLLDVGVDRFGLVRGWVPAPIRRRITRIVTRRIAPHLDQVWHDVAAATLLRCTLSGADQRVDATGAPPDDGWRFDASLESIEFATVAGLLHTSDRDELHQRMVHVVDLLRSRQRDRSLTVRPFSTAQLAWMVRGEVPPGI